MKIFGKIAIKRWETIFAIVSSSVLALIAIIAGVMAMIGAGNYVGGIVVIFGGITIAAFCFGLQLFLAILHDKSAAGLFRETNKEK